MTWEAKARARHSLESDHSESRDSDIVGRWLMTQATASSIFHRPLFIMGPLLCGMQSSDQHRSTHGATGRAGVLASNLSQHIPISINMLDYISIYRYILGNAKLPDLVQGGRFPDAPHYWPPNRSFRLSERLVGVQS
jgi:hypothetical protein